jgi:hypothetical protein
MTSRRASAWRAVALACMVATSEGCYFTAAFFAVGERERIHQLDANEVLATPTSVIVKTRLETCGVDRCGVAADCSTEDVWWTIDAAALRRGEPTLAGATERRGRFPDTLGARSLTWPSDHGVPVADERDGLCLAADPASPVRGWWVLVGCGDDRRSVRIPPPWLPSGRYRAWWSYPLLALVPAAILADGLTMPIQLQSSRTPPGCPHGDW